MPELSIRGGLKKPPPLRYPLSPPAAPAAAVASRPVVRKRKAKKNLRQKSGAALVALGMMLAVYGWTMAERDPARGLLMNLGSSTTLLRPICVCEGHFPKAGSCLRAGYLGANCAQRGFEFSPPLAGALTGALALAWLGAGLMRRKNKMEVRTTEIGVPRA